MTSNQVDRTASEVARLRDNRWLILFFSVVSMVAVANFQYGWTLFVPPLQKHLGVDRATIQVTFTVFVLLETWLVPFEGWLVDRFGPRLLVMLGGIFAGLGWFGAGKAETITALYLSYALAGIGAGVVYGTAIGSALKWFPDHRGLAAGLTAAGFGAGSAFTVTPIANLNQHGRISDRIHPVGNHPGRPSSSSPRSSSKRRRRAGCRATGRRWTPGTT
jgi:OFA family oxalate/formate antiporter-like MFS transporter